MAARKRNPPKRKRKNASPPEECSRVARIQALQEELDYLRSQEAPPSPPVEAVVIEETSFVVGKGEEPVPNPRRKRANAPPTFREAHWGIDPKRKEPFDVPDPRDNTAMIALGELVAATYGTKKGATSGSPTTSTRSSGNARCFATETRMGSCTWSGEITRSRSVESWADLAEPPKPAIR